MAMKISIDFNDGLDVTYKVAFPIMEKYGFHGTIFPVTDAVRGRIDPQMWGRNDEVNYEVKTRSMTLEELEELYSHGWEIGGHTKTHSINAEIPLKKVEDEIRSSTEYLKDAGFEPETFAFHGGMPYTEEIVEIVKRYYKRARAFRSLEHKLNTPPYKLYGLYSSPLDHFPPSISDYHVFGWLIVFNHVLTDPRGFEEWLKILKKEGVEVLTYKEILGE